MWPLVLSSAVAGKTSVLMHWWHAQQENTFLAVYFLTSHF